MSKVKKISFMCERKSFMITLITIFLSTFAIADVSIAEWYWKDYNGNAADELYYQNFTIGIPRLA